MTTPRAITWYYPGATPVVAPSRQKAAPLFRQQLPGVTINVGKVSAHRPLSAAEQQLVADNQGLARSKAQHVAYVTATALGRPGQVRQFYEELIGAGMEGLCIAAQRFNPNRNIRFSTYAVWWIKSLIGDAQQRCLLTTKRNRHGEGSRLSLVGLFSEVHDLAKKPMHNDDGSFLAVDVPDTSASLLQESDDPEEWLLPLLKSVLPERYAAILMRHLMQETYRSVAKQYGISKQRVQQIVAKSVKMLREMPHVVDALLERCRRSKEDTCGSHDGKMVTRFLA